MPTVFSYGSLQRPEVQVSTFGRLLDGRPDALPRYELGHSGPHANAVSNESSDSQVPGMASNSRTLNWPPPTASSWPTTTSASPSSSHRARRRGCI